MGQQQLLLIVLSVIILAIAVVVAINLYNSYLITTNEEALVAEALNLGSLAQTYYFKPISLVGGQGSFERFSIPNNIGDTPHGLYTIVSATQNEIVIKGIGKIVDSENKVAQTVITVTPNNIVTDELIRVNP
jgi:photosystem II stability/assembly factor-like uncharacterized protein